MTKTTTKTAEQLQAEIAKWDERLDSYDAKAKTGTIKQQQMYLSKSKIAFDKRQALRDELAALTAEAAGVATPRKAGKGMKVTKTLADVAAEHKALGSMEQADAKSGVGQKPNVWQTRVNAALLTGTRSGGDGSMVVHTCPTPKTATGTAAKLRQMIGEGKVTAPTGYVVKSRKADIVLVSA